MDIIINGYELIYIFIAIISRGKVKPLVLTGDSLLSVLLGTVLSLLTVNSVEALGLEQVSDGSGSETDTDLLGLGVVGRLACRILDDDMESQV